MTPRRWLIYQEEMVGFYNVFWHHTGPPTVGNCLQERERIAGEVPAQGIFMAYKACNSKYIISKSSPSDQFYSLSLFIGFYETH